MKKENASQRIERIKKKKNGLDVIDDILIYSKGLKKIDPEDIDRFKWYGLYTQNENLQDEDDKTLYFMLRVKLNDGTINLKQLKVLANISKEFAKNTADFTTRQDIQFHFIKIIDLPEIFKQLAQVGLSSKFAAGDVPRNVVTCPVSGVDSNEIYDTRDLAKKISEYFNNNEDDLSNLPRKYKVSISGCNKHCVGHEIQDLSFTAVEIDNEILFDVQVGGGLASNKKFSLHLGYIKDIDVLRVCKKITLLYRDLGLREKRTKSRLRHLIDHLGLDKFKSLIENQLNFKFINKKLTSFTPYIKREHFGVHKSKDNHLLYLATYVNGGSIYGLGLTNLYKVLKKYNLDKIKLTTSQNFIIFDILKNDKENIIEDLQNINIDCNPSVFKAKTIACTGIKFCKFAISETKNTAINLVEFLQKEFPSFNEKLSISINGCPNSCAHPHIVDIGLLGCKIKDKNGKIHSGFEIIVNGNLEGENSKFGKKIGKKILESEANITIKNLIDEYLISEYKNLQDYLNNKIDISN